MNRQIKKVIFLPANKIILAYSGHSYIPKFKVIENEEFFYKSWVHRLFRIKTIRRFEFPTLEPFKIDYDNVKIWDAIVYCEAAGYEVILYPEKNATVSQNHLNNAFSNLVEKKLVIKLLNGNLPNDFLDAIKLFNINVQNSILVAEDSELINQIQEHFKLRNAYSNGDILTKPLGFYSILWNIKQEKTDLKWICFADNEIKLVECLTKGDRMNPSLYASIGLPEMVDKIIFVDEEDSNQLHSFIKKNLKWIQKQCKNNGCTFIYFPEIVRIFQNNDFISEYLRYSHPDLPSEFISKMDFSGIGYQQLQKLFLEYFNFPHFMTPALLRNLGSIENLTNIQYSLFSFDKNKCVKTQFESYFKFLRPANDSSGLFYSLIRNQRDNSADNNFESEAQKLTDDVIQKIKWLRKEGDIEMLAEIALWLSHNADFNNAINLASDKITIEQRFMSPLVSRLRIEWISKYDFHILLPDYGNLLIEMPRLPKALYYFFLKHPEGVMLNSLANYKYELLSIYEQISNIGEKEEIVKNIDRLIDPFDNSINVNCSRIKSAFVKQIDDKLAKNYYVTGLRGEPKKIILPVTLIEILQKN